MPQYIIIARDNPNSLDKRMAARTAHLDGVHALKSNGNFIKAAALLNEKGEMAGSVMLLEFSTREEFDTYKSNEPYVLQNVWGDIEISEVKVAPM